MRLAFYIFFGQSIILCSDYYLINVNALTGENIRHPNPNEYLFVVAIVRVSNENYNLIQIVCIGTLVTDQDILTAEHCLEGRNVPYTAIITGSIDFRLGIRHSLCWWMTYNSWSPRFQQLVDYDFNDVSMLRLISKVPGYIIPATISREPIDNYRGLQGTIASWTTISTNIIPTILDLGDVEILSGRQCIQLCESFFNRNRNAVFKLFCSFAEPSIQLENGDSGGPLIHQGILIGINNGLCESTTYASEFKINLHTSIEYYLYFVDSIIAMP